MDGHCLKPLLADPDPLKEHDQPEGKSHPLPRSRLHGRYAMDGVTQFRQALEGAYGAFDWLPIADGAIHRFRTPHSTLGSLSAWYRLSVDGREGCFGSLGIGGTFTAVSEQSLAGA